MAAEAGMIDNKAVDQTTPLPPRWRWTRRWLAISAALLAALALLWLCWAHAASRRLAAEVDAIRVRHEPLYPEDFASSPVATSQNAAKYFIDAAAAQPANEAFPSPSESDTSFKPYPPFSAQWHQMEDAALAHSARTLVLVRQARTCDRADWGFLPTESQDWFAAFHGGRTIVLVFGEMRELAYVLHDAALDAHEHHDDYEAMERVADLLHLARMMVQGQPDLWWRLTVIGIEDEALTALQMMLPDVEVSTSGGAPTTVSAHRPATRDQAMGLIAELMDDAYVRRADERAVLGERMLVFNTLNVARRASILSRPRWEYTAAQALVDYNFFFKILQEPTLSSARLAAAARPDLPQVDYVPSGNAPKTQAVYGEPLINCVSISWKTISHRRAVATAIAVRLFRIDHGRWPATLNELVPKYLPAVPADVFDPNGGPMRYVILPHALPDGRDRPMLYYDVPPSGQLGPPPSEPSYSYSGQGDPAWRDLERWSPPPTSQP